MNKKLIEAKIHDIRAQIALLEAQIEGAAEGEGEVQGAVGVGLEVASTIEFQRWRIHVLETLLGMTEEEVRTNALGLLQAWTREPRLEIRVNLSLMLYALQSSLEDFMAWVEAQEAADAR